jgi:tetratricopeptide (TPR) repeat protein
VRYFDFFELGPARQRGFRVEVSTLAICCDIDFVGFDSDIFLGCVRGNGLKLLTDQALALNPNLAWAWLFSGWVRMWGGDADAGIERVGHALRLSPNDPHSFSMYCAMGFALFFARRYDEATLWAERAAREKPDVLLSTILAAASNAHAGRPEQARRAIGQVRRIDPALRMFNLKGLFPIRRPEDFELWAEGVRKAGLPE